MSFSVVKFIKNKDMKNLKGKKNSHQWTSSLKLSGKKKKRNVSLNKTSFPRERKESSKIDLHKEIIDKSQNKIDATSESESDTE